MHEITNEPSRNRGCRLYGCLLLIGLPLLMVVLVLIMFFGREASGKRRLAAKIEELRAAGMPYDIDSLQDYYHQQTDPRDTQRWLAVLNTLSSVPFQQSTKGVPNFDRQIQQDIPPPGEPWDAESEVATRTFLKQWSELLRETRELSLVGKPVRFPIEFNEPDTILTHAQDVRQAVRLLALHGKMSLQDSNSLEGAQAITAIWGASDVLSGEPFLGSQLASIAFDGIGLEVLRQGLQSGVFQPAELRDLLPTTLAKIEIGQTWRTAMIGDRAWSIPNFSNTSQTVGVTIPGRAHDTLLFLEIAQRAIDLPTQDLDQFRAESKRIKDDLKQRTMGNPLSMFDSIMTVTLSPALNALASAFSRRAMQHRLAAVAIGLSLYENQHGHFPKTLLELSELKLGLEKLGPSAGKSFGYRIDSDGTAQLWSFNLRTAEVVPDGPYDTTNSETSDDAMWVWELSQRH